MIDPEDELLEDEEQQAESDLEQFAETDANIDPGNAPEVDDSVASDDDLEDDPEAMDTGFAPPEDSETTDDADAADAANDMAVAEAIGGAAMISGAALAMDAQARAAAKAERQKKFEEERQERERMRQERMSGSKPSETPAPEAESPARRTFSPPPPPSGNADAPVDDKPARRTFSAPPPPSGGAEAPADDKPARRTFSAPPPPSDGNDEAPAERASHRTFSAPPPPSGGSEDVAAKAPAHVPRPKPEGAADKPLDAKAQERAERAAAHAASMDERKQAAAAKQAERQAAHDAKMAGHRRPPTGDSEAADGEEASGGRRRASHASDFSELREEASGVDAAIDARKAAMTERFGALAQRGATEGAAIVAGFNKAKEGQAAGPPVARVGPAPAPMPAGGNDYLDIIQHLDARAESHDEYRQIRQKFESRLLVGGEILRCTLVGLNANLIDSVYRKLSGIADFLARVEWRYVAIEPVIVVTENGQRREVPIKSYPVTIGRDASSTIALSSGHVSRAHAEIHNLTSEPNLPPQWQLKDVGSTHGTTLNGSTLRSPLSLDPGDKIELGTAFASTDYPSLQLINRAIPYGRDDLKRMVVEVDLVIAVVEADREFEGQQQLLRNLSDAQRMGGLLVLAISKSGAIDDSMEANIDELKHAAHVVKSQELTRYLAAIDENDIHGDEEWLVGVCNFIDGFRQKAYTDVLVKRKQITRQEVVQSIRETGIQLEAKLSKQLEDAERNLQRVTDEVSSAPRNLGSAEFLRDDTFKTLKQILEDDINYYSEPLRPDSLVHFAETLVERLEVTTKGKKTVDIHLVEPDTQDVPHRWLISNLNRAAVQHFDQLMGQITGPQRNPHGIAGLYQNLRELLGGHDKLRSTDLFLDDNYLRQDLSALTRQMHAALDSDYTQFQAKTDTKIDNIFIFLITKTRYAVMFYMSMFSIGAVIFASSRQKLQKALAGSIPQPVWIALAVTIIACVIWFNVVQYRANVKESVTEESDKLRDQLKKHYMAVAKKFVEDAKRVFSIHLSTQETKIKQDMSSLGSSRMSDSMMSRNNPVLDQARKERDDIQTQVYAIGQERLWAESAEKGFAQSPFVQAAPARRPLRS